MSSPRSRERGAGVLPPSPLPSGLFSSRQEKPARTPARRLNGGPTPAPPDLWSWLGRAILFSIASIGPAFPSTYFVLGVGTGAHVTTALTVRNQGNATASIKLSFL